MLLWEYSTLTWAGKRTPFAKVAARVELCPESTDALNGPLRACDLALVYALTGEIDQAVTADRTPPADSGRDHTTAFLTVASPRLNCVCAGNGISSAAILDSRNFSTDRSPKRSIREIRGSRVGRNDETSQYQVCLAIIAGSSLRFVRRWPRSRPPRPPAKVPSRRRSSPSNRPLPKQRMRVVPQRKPNASS